MLVWGSIDRQDNGTLRTTSPLRAANRSKSGTSRQISGRRRKSSGPPFWKRKFWKHKYFWPVVGVAAGVVVVGAVASAATGGLSPGQKVGLFPVVSF